MKNRFLFLPIGLCLCFSLLVSSPSLAGGGNDEQSSGSNASPVDLKTIKRELSELRSSLHELKRDAKSLLAEFQREDTRILEFGDFINDYIDDKPTPYQEQLYPYGFQNIGNTGTTTVPLPPRKEWVAHYSDALKKLTRLTEKEFSDVIAHLGTSISSESASECRAQMGRLVSSTETVSTLNEKSDVAQCQKIIAEILDEIAQLELCTKRLVRQRVST